MQGITKFESLCHTVLNDLGGNVSLGRYFVSRFACYHRTLSKLVSTSSKKRSNNNGLRLSPCFRPKEVVTGGKILFLILPIKKKSYF